VLLKGKITGGQDLCGWLAEAGAIKEQNHWSSGSVVNLCKGWWALEEQASGFGVKIMCARISGVKEQTKGIQDLW
jgi:hypothetical protein